MFEAVLIVIGVFVGLGLAYVLRNALIRKERVTDREDKQRAEELEERVVRLQAKVYLRFVDDDE